jgi:hypothetical protein
MQFINRKIIGITFLGLFFITASYADEVVMITGEHFTTSKVWEEDGKIRFNMHGLAVSVNKSDVASIMVTGGSTSQAPHREPSPSPAPQQKHASQKELVTAKVSPPPSPHSPVKKIKPKANIQGIGFNGISWHMRPTELPGIEKIKTEEAYGGIRSKEQDLHLDVLPPAEALQRLVEVTFDHHDEQQFASFMQSIGVILETQRSLGAADS